MEYTEIIESLDGLGHDYYTIYRCITMDHTNADIGISGIKHAITTHKANIPNDFDLYVQLIELAIKKLEEWDESHMLKGNMEAIIYLDAIEHNIKYKILPILKERNDKTN